MRRDLQPRLRAHLSAAHQHRGVVVLGPRQVGKSVVLRQTIDDLLDDGWPPRNLVYFDFKDERTLTEPVSARTVVDSSPPRSDERYPRVFLFDEIGAVEGWDRWLRSAVDAGDDRFAVTDSAATLLREGGRESGPGRWDEWPLEGLTFTEFARLATGTGVDAALARFPNLIERYLVTGGFPEHVRNDDLAEVRRRIRVDTAERAILIDLRNPGLDTARLRTLFVYLMKESGAIFVAAERAQQDLDADARTVRGWLSWLYQTMLAVPLERHVARPSGGLRSRPKVYAADHGLVMAFADDPSAAAVRGRVFEAAVFRHLRGVAAATDAEPPAYYRDRAGRVEADFVLDGGRVVVEVTARRDIDAAKRKAVRTVAQRTGAERAVIVYGGLRQGEQDGVHIVPIAQFLLDPTTAVSP